MHTPFVTPSGVYTRVVTTKAKGNPKNLEAKGILFNRTYL